MRGSGWAAFAIAVTLTAAAQTSDAPQLKEGLWFLHTVTTTKPGNKSTDEVISLCRNHAFDQYANAMAMMQQNCNVKRTWQGETMTLDGTCTEKGSTVVSKGTMKMTGDTVTHSEIHTTYTPALHGVVESTMVQDQTWLSSCPSGMKPGQQRSADPNSMHLKD